MNGPDDLVTLGEVSRRLGSLETRVEKEFGKLDNSINSLRFVHLDQYRAERDADRHRISELEDTHKWLVRAVVVSILFPLILAIAGAVILGGAQ
jgi:hypothetical protein